MEDGLPLVGDPDFAGSDDGDHAFGWDEIGECIETGLIDGFEADEGGDIGGKTFNEVVAGGEIAVSGEQGIPYGIVEDIGRRCFHGAKVFKNILWGRMAGCLADSQWLVSDSQSA